MVEAGIEACAPESVANVLTNVVAQPLSARTRFPVMSNLAPDKSTPLSSAQITQVRMGFDERVRRATDIVVIGACPREHDQHIWRPVRGCGAEKSYVGGNYADLGVPGARFLGDTFEQAWEPLLEVLNRLATVM
jgi:hypothetical protein